jgi:hypothetical protein
MWHKTAMVALAATCAGCMTAEDRRAADEAKCRSYGFVRKKTPSPNVCSASISRGARTSEVRRLSILGTGR